MTVLVVSQTPSDGDNIQTSDLCRLVIHLIKSQHRDRKLTLVFDVFHGTPQRLRLTKKIFNILILI